MRQPVRICPIAELTTWELRKLREECERRLGMDTLPPASKSREELAEEIKAVTAEQEERKRIAERAKAAAHADS